MNRSEIVTGRHEEGKQLRALQMRRQMTPAEKILWQHLRAGRLQGLHFRRQQVIDGFIADFYCHSAGLVVEVDGAVHEEQRDYDRERDRIITGRGLHILRVTNSQVTAEIKNVLTQIAHAAAEQRRKVQPLEAEQKQQSPIAPPSPPAGRL